MPHAFRAFALASALAVGALACSPASRPEISIRVLSPSQSVLSTGDLIRLQAEVQGTTDARVAWSGEGINAAGIFTSPTPGTFTVVVRPLADPSRRFFTLSGRTDIWAFSIGPVSSPLRAIACPTAR